MQETTSLPDEEFRSHAFALLGQELGAYGLARFIRLTTSGSGDYTRDRHQWLDGITIEQIAEELKTNAQTKAA